MADEYILKSYEGGAETTTLTAQFNVGNISLSVSNGSSFPDGSSGPFVVVVDRGTATEEKFLIDTASGNNKTTFTIQQAAYDGTSASAHAVGAIVEHCLDAYSIEQANRYVNLQSAKGDLVTHNGTTTAKLGVGANNTVIVADSTQSLGIKYATLGTNSISDTSITEAKIANSAVTAGKIATGAVSENKIADGAVTNGKLGANAVTAAKISTAAAGTTGQILTANTTVASGLEWTSPAQAGVSLPVGSIIQYAAGTAPTGWRLCNGDEVSRTGATAALFAVIGTTYGAGDGSTTFLLPDFRSRFPVGKGGSTWSDALGESGGSPDAVLVTHSHGGVTQMGLSATSMSVHEYGGTSTAGNHVTGYNNALPSGGSIGNNSDSFPGASHDHVINSEGVAGTNKNLPPYITVNYLIKT